MGRSNDTSATPPAPAGPAFVGAPRLPSVGGAGTAVTGKLSFDTPMRIDGTMRGELRSTALLVIGEQGSVEGTVRAAEVVVLGEVRGEIRGARRLEIGAAGRVYGTVETHTLIVNEGGLLEATCAVGR